ncbi:MAG: hypothetical protein AAGA91_16185 [Pseudomonadota bacterium]
MIYLFARDTFLAPDIMEAIIMGKIPDSLSLESLKRDFPVAWNSQRKHFGFRCVTVS